MVSEQIPIGDNILRATIPIFNVIPLKSHLTADIRQSFNRSELQNNCKPQIAFMILWERALNPHHKQKPYYWLIVAYSTGCGIFSAAYNWKIQKKKTYIHTGERLMHGLQTHAITQTQLYEGNVHMNNLTDNTRTRYNNNLIKIANNHEIIIKLWNSVKNKKFPITT